ncbi:hypothetical protein EON64_07275 [archaeon]|nr:MAG: hypothetical protein EON64_07275 [archaeon]
MEWHPHDLILPVPPAMNMATGSITLLTAALKDLGAHSSPNAKPKQQISAMASPLSVHPLELSDILNVNDKGKELGKSEGGGESASISSERVQERAAPQLQEGW